MLSSPTTAALSSPHVVAKPVRHVPVVVHVSTPIILIVLILTLVLPRVPLPTITPHRFVQCVSTPSLTPLSPFFLSPFYYTFLFPSFPLFLYTPHQAVSLSVSTTCSMLTVTLLFIITPLTLCYHSFYLHSLNNSFVHPFFSPSHLFSHPTLITCL